MITINQVETLAYFYKINQVNIVREYLQLLFLAYLYQQKEADDIYFKGGTAIHLIYKSPRFSEDLDFSTTLLKEEINKVVKITLKQITDELSGVEIKPLHRGRETIRYRLIYKKSGFKYPFVIRLDFTEKDKPIIKPTNSSLITKFPITLFPVINHLAESEILAEKIRAFMVRAKGRDIFDLWYLLKKGVDLDKTLIKRKFLAINRKYQTPIFIESVNKFPQKKLEMDLNQFLPITHRKLLGSLKKDLISILSK